MKQNWVKNGKTADGRQRFYDTISHKSKLNEYRIFDTNMKFLAISLKLKGMTFRDVADIVGCTHPTIINWYKKFADLFTDDFVLQNQNKTFDDVELDEMFTYVQKKRTKYTYGLPMTGNPIL